MEDIVKIFTGNTMEVQRIASFLDENEIPVLIKDNNQSAIIAGFGMPMNSVELFVESQNEEKARQILDAMKSGVE